MHVLNDLTVNGVRVAGRLWRSGTSEHGTDADGNPTDALRDLYVRLAEGGTPLIVTGYAYVRRDGMSGTGQNAIHEDRLVEPWAAITAAVHRAAPDCRIVMQIVHGGRQCKPASVADTLAPSAVPCPRFGQNPRAMTEVEIGEMIEAFARAAARAKAAVFDGVQLHAAHGYLISQFNSPHTNRRTDAWGGSPEKRMRFFRDVLRRTRAAVGNAFPVLTKLNADDCLPDGLTPELSAGICRMLIDEGIDAIELSAWMAEADPARQPSRKFDPPPEQEGYFRDACRTIRNLVPHGVPLGTCGGWRSVAVMDRLIDADGFDFVCASRPFIAEPDLFARLRSGQPRAACNSCNECVSPGSAGTIRCPPAEENRLAAPQE